MTETITALGAAYSLKDWNELPLESEFETSKAEILAKDWKAGCIQAFKQPTGYPNLFDINFAYKAAYAPAGLVTYEMQSGPADCQDMTPEEVIVFSNDPTLRNVNSVQAVIRQYQKLKI